MLVQEALLSRKLILSPVSAVKKCGLKYSIDGEKHHIIFPYISPSSNIYPLYVFINNGNGLPFMERMSIAGNN